MLSTEKLACAACVGGIGTECEGRITEEGLDVKNSKWWGVQAGRSMVNCIEGPGAASSRQGNAFGEADVTTETKQDKTVP